VTATTTAREPAGHKMSSKSENTTTTASTATNSDMLRLDLLGATDVQNRWPRTRAATGSGSTGANAKATGRCGPVHVRG
jgi:hypothetical protein